MIKCEICEGIIRKNRYYTLKNGFKKLVKKSYTLPSKNPKRCKDCEYVERRVKHKCISCESLFKNNLENYIRNGNFCFTCIDIVNIETEIKKIRNTNSEQLRKKREVRLPYLYEKLSKLNKLLLC
jgi:hypothetical protein